MKQDEAHALLVGYGFTLVHDDGYVGWERYPDGWGSDGNARNERVTFDPDDDTFYAGAFHVEPDGEHTFNADSPTFSTANEAIGWLASAKAKPESKP